MTVTIHLAFVIVVGMIVSVFGLVMGLLLGKRIGRMCSCCGLDTECNFCVRHRCKNAEKHRA